MSDDLRRPVVSRARAPYRYRWTAADYMARARAVVAAERASTDRNTDEETCTDA